MCKDDRHGRVGEVTAVLRSRANAMEEAKLRELLERLNTTLTPENLRSDESMFAKLRRAFGSQAA